MVVTMHVVLALAAATGPVDRVPAAQGRLAPIAPTQAISTHGPFEMGACEACHDGKDRAGVPGPVLKRSNALCFDCHDDYQKPMKGHPSPQDDCTTCHSPHNAKKKKLLTR
jgi:predicted CXXCH cytochrome family protein